MKGVISRVEGRKLLIEVDLDQDFGPSSSGKSNFVATTSGFSKVDVDPGVSFSLNVIRSNKVQKQPVTVTRPTSSTIETLTA